MSLILCLARGDWTYSSTFGVRSVDVEGGLCTPQGLSVWLWGSGYQCSHRLGCVGVVGFS